MAKTENDLQWLIDGMTEEINTLKRRHEYLVSQNKQLQDKFFAVCDEREFLRKTIAVANQARDFWRDRYREEIKQKIELLEKRKEQKQ